MPWWCKIGIVMSDFVRKKNLYVPEQAFGVCIWILPSGKPLMDDDDNYLCAEGFLNDKKVEKMVAEAARYETGSSEGHVKWVGGARKTTQSEKDDQVERLKDGLMPDPYQDAIEQIARKELLRRGR